ncbi:MAG: hypothetical protein HY903_08550 [Deltaproteobacteria bacterium]|nr:hypothetical protein [Deltaproteobacteria bacterium]
MATLKELLLAPAVRPKVIDDCVTLVDDEVAAKSGLAGLAIKAAYAIVKKVKPGIIREAVDHLLDDFVARLEPFYAESLQAKSPVDSYFGARAEAIADALLGVTDARAERAKNKTIKAAYDKLRPTGVKHTAAAVPGVARLIGRHA